MPSGVTVGPARVDRVIGPAAKKDAPPMPPILSVSVGTAGASRNWRFLQRMAHAGRLDRVGSAIICDYNSGTVRRMQGRIKGKHVDQRVMLPETIPTADGFLLNPYEFGKYLGDVGDGLKSLVDQVHEQAQNSNSQPQLILEFLGFGGHAIVGLMMHRMLRERFPGARCLPVVALPANEMLHDWMRRQVQDPPPETTLPDWMLGGTWEAYEAGMDLGPYGCCLVVDNRIDAPPNDDLALGLAVIEAAGTDPIKRGSLPEALGGILLEGPGWVGMNVVRRVVPSRKVRTWGIPIIRRRPVWSSSNNDLVVQTKEAIKECIRGGSLLERPGGMGSEDPMAVMANNGNGNPSLGVNSNGYYAAGPNGNGNGHYAAGANGNGSGNGHYASDANGNGYYHQSAPVQQPLVYVTIPVPNNTVREVVRSVTRQLKTEGFYERHQEIDICFGSANFPDLPDADDDNEYYQTAPRGFWRSLAGLPITAAKLLGNVILWPPKMLVKLGERIIFGGEERHQKEMSVVAVSLYPVHGRIRRVDEILHRNAQDPNGNEAFSGFGTRVHSKPPTPPEAPETPEAHAPEDDPEPQESPQSHTPEDDPEPQESPQAHAPEADPEPAAPEQDPEPAAETVGAGETLS